MIPVVALVVSSCSLLISAFSLLISVDAWRRTARPVVAVAVKTHAGSNVAILYDLVVLNSGTMPAKNIRLIAEPISLSAAFGADATQDNKKGWLACFDIVIPALLNNERTTCSFGTTKANDTGFWKHGAIIDIEVVYEGRWRTHRDKQQLRILDTDSFTGHHWA
ncbi:hypothetical protein N2605_02460 [Bradyrhizobium yuanmingense]|uniref:hypothetical protein n=1 Tax=Bradyrhizobium yuanmingense TaxID=108015 RepID=UPI0021A2850E|nr:hypothetical protein [Bradyrhizobium sp. CB1024]UWU85343.1 hypothetical protein N2605_02460 [Bradyrhizobium sp. CB1024]